MTDFCEMMERYKELSNQPQDKGTPDVRQKAEENRIPDVEGGSNPQEHPPS